MNEQMKASMKGLEVVVREDALEGARRASESASSLAPPAPGAEVVATAKRRRFTDSEKRRILATADRCTEPGEIGELPRREGIYSLNLTPWRKQREAADLAALAPKKRGRQRDPALAEARRIGELNKDNDRLRRQLARAHLIIDIQKKACLLLGRNR